MIQTVLVADFGTSNVRVNAIELSHGTTVASTSVPYGKAQCPEGCLELDARNMWQCVQDCMRGTLAKLSLDDHKLCAISFSFIGNSMLPVDATGEPTHNLILCFDPRGEEEAKELNEKLGTQRMVELTGAEADSGCTAAKILHFMRHMPEQAARTDKYYTIQQYILRKLGLPDVNDVTMGCLKSMMDNQNQVWSQEILDAVGVSADKMGQIVQGSTVVGEVDHFGDVALPYPIPVVPGAHDSDCGYVGLGVGEGSGSAVAEVAGTFDHIGMIVAGHVNSQAAFPGQDIWSTRGPLPDTSACLSAYATSGALLEWFMREIMGSTAQETYRYLWDNAVFDGREGVHVHPQFSAQQGALSSLSVGTTRVDMFRGIIETLTFETRRCIELCQKVNPHTIDTIRIGGGGAKEDRWVQLRADITGKTFQKMQEIEGSALGAAILAAVGIGVYADAAEAISHMVRVEKTFTPRPDVFQRYNARYHQYLADHYA